MRMKAGQIEVDPVPLYIRRRHPNLVERGSRICVLDNRHGVVGHPRPPGTRIRRQRGVTLQDQLFRFWSRRLFGRRRDLPGRLRGLVCQCRRPGGRSTTPASTTAAGAKRQKGQRGQPAAKSAAGGRRGFRHGRHNRHQRGVGDAVPLRVAGNLGNALRAQPPGIAGGGGRRFHEHPEQQILRVHQVADLVGGIALRARRRGPAPDHIMRSVDIVEVDQAADLVNGRRLKRVVGDRLKAEPDHVRLGLGRHRRAARRGGRLDETPASIGKRRRLVRAVISATGGGFIRILTGLVRPARLGRRLSAGRQKQGQKGKKIQRRGGPCLAKARGDATPLLPVDRSQRPAGLGQQVLHLFPNGI